MRGASFRRFRVENAAIISNAMSLVGTSGVTAFLGFLYWGLAAHHFAQGAIAEASASVSAMVLLGTVASLGWGTLLLGELPRQPGRRGELIATALTVTGLFGAVLGCLFALIAPLFFFRLRPFDASIWTVGLFGVGVSLTAVALVADQAVIGLLRGSLQFWRNVVFSVGKLAALLISALWLGQRSGTAIYATWTAGVVVSLVVLAGLGLRYGGRPWAHRPSVQLVRSLTRGALDHHLLNLALQVSSLLLPLIASNQLSAHLAASFYIAFIIATGLWAIPYALSTVLYAVGNAEPLMLAQKTRVTVGLALLAGVSANVLLLFGAGPLLSLFGHSYRLEGVTILHILAFAIFPVIIKDHYVAIRRIQGRVTPTIAISIAASGFEVVCAALGGHFAGLTGVGFGWLVALTLEATLMAPVVYAAAQGYGRARDVDRAHSEAAGRATMSPGPTGVMPVDPLVSIIINNYNYARFLATAVDSALAQTYPRVEVIIVDDGSTDDSATVMSSYEHRATIVLKRNGGQASALNAGMCRCKGDIVIFLDSDDALLPDTAERVVHAFMAHSDVAKVQYRMEIIGADNNRTGVIKPPPHLPMRSGDLRRHVLSFPEDNTWMATSGNAFNAHVLRQIFPMPEDEFRILADEYVRNVAVLFGTVVSLDYVGALYRMHGSNSFEGYAWDLQRIRQSISHMVNTHAYIQRYATSLHLEEFMFQDGEAGSVSFLAHRLVSLRLDPDNHPIASDRIVPLYRLSLVAVSRRFDVRRLMKMFYIVWFTGFAFGPRFLVKWLAIKFFFPETRGSLNRVLGMLHRA